MPLRRVVAVIGGGIAGATAACHIAPEHDVVLLEQEAELAFHTTSRSAAICLEHDGNNVWRGLNQSSRSFFETAHDELDAPLLEPLPVLNVHLEAARNEALADAAMGTQRTPAVRFVDTDELQLLCPPIDTAVVGCGVLEASAASIDVMAIHQLYVRRAMSHGAQVLRNARVTAIERHSAAAIDGEFPTSLTERGVHEKDLAPNRLR